MCRTLLILVIAAVLSSACCLACRPTPKAGPVELVTLLTDPEPYTGVKVIVRLRIDAYDPATRLASRTVASGKAPLYVCKVPAGEDDPTPGMYEVSGTVEGHDRADTGLGDRPYTIRLRDCKLTRLSD